jgi:apolipoprotein N-acyltransferase
MLFIITNDGWWNGTVGYTQHLRYSQLRAIETRRYIARCANTGISAFINSKGIIEQSTEWWKQTAITGNIRTNDERTFYVCYGDYIGRGAIVVSFLLILVFGVKCIIVRRNT